MKVVERGNCKSSHHKEKTFSYFFHLVSLWDDGCLLQSVIISWCMQVKSLCCTPSTYSAGCRSISIKLEEKNYVLRPLYRKFYFSLWSLTKLWKKVMKIISILKVFSLSRKVTEYRRNVIDTNLQSFDLIKMPFFPSPGWFDLPVFRLARMTENASCPSGLLCFWGSHLDQHPSPLCRQVTALANGTWAERTQATSWSDPEKSFGKSCLCSLFPYPLGREDPRSWRKAWP